MIHLVALPKVCSMKHAEKVDVSNDFFLSKLDQSGEVIFFLPYLIFKVKFVQFYLASHNLKYNHDNRLTHLKLVQIARHTKQIYAELCVARV